VSKILIKLTIPMTFGIVGMVAFNLVDTYFVGRLGTKELAALSFTFPIVLLINSLAMGLGMGASAVISRAIGEGD
jgi:Na+-driven multidrug efflux pump